MERVSENYRKAFVEIEAVLKCLNSEDYNKIPQNFINEIEKNKDENYCYKYNKNLEYYKWNFMPETKALLYNIFKNYLASEEQKDFFKKREIIETNKLEEEKKKKYNPDNIFKNRVISDGIYSENIENKPIKNEKSLIKVKENVFSKIVKRIKKIFHIA